MVKFAHTLYKKMHLKEENYFGKNSPIALPKAMDCDVLLDIVRKFKNISQKSKCVKRTTKAR